MSMRHCTNATFGSSASNWTLKCTDLPQFDALEKEADHFCSDDKLHLRNLCNDAARCAGLSAILLSKGPAGRGQHVLPGSNTMSKIILDYSRQRVTGETMELLYDLGDAVGLMDRREAMRSGEPVNVTEGKPVLHHVLRMPSDYNLVLKNYNNHNGTNQQHQQQQQQHQHQQHHQQQQQQHYSASGRMLHRGMYQQQNNSNGMNNTNEPVDGPGLLRQVHSRREQIYEFSQELRGGRYRSIRNKPFRSVLVIAVGGWSLGTECVAEALQADPRAVEQAAGRTLRFLTNLDPIDFALCTADLDPAETLVVVVSKTFADPQTMLNARTVRQWLLDSLLPAATTTATSTATAGGVVGGPTSRGNTKWTEKEIVARHMVAVSANAQRCAQFGILKAKVFRIQEWVSGRFSVSSAVGILPLALQYSYPICSVFLEGLHDMDEHFFHAPLRDNIPVIMGLLGVWNSTFLGSSSRVILPYCQALSKFPAYIQHLDMESNGKRVALDGTPLLHSSGEVTFGSVGTIAEHGFFQLLHQGRVVPADFIGLMESPYDIDLPGEACSSHDELMAHFFAQPDALAYGKTLVDLSQENTPEPLREHMVFTGNRPSSSLLMTRLDAFSIGQLMAMYEHRTAVQGFMWGINSFDQFGGDLGMVLGRTVRAQLAASRKTAASVQGFNSSTTSLLSHYLAHGQAQKEQKISNS